MIERNKFVVDIIFSIIVLIGIVWLTMNFEYFLIPDKPSGKAAKAFILFINFLNRIGGKVFSICVISVLVSPYIIRTAIAVYKRINEKANKSNK